MNKFNFIFEFNYIQILIKMSLFSNIKNSKYYYPPIGRMKNNNNIHLTDINIIKNFKIKKNINNQIIPKKITRNLHLNKSNSYNNISNINNKNDLYTQENTDNSLLLNLKTRNNSKKDKILYHDNESLYESNIQLKTEINKLKKELMQLKAENQRKESELIKKDKLLQNAFDKGIDEDNIINNIVLNDNNNIFLEKDIKKNNFISKFRKQYNELKSKYKEKIEEITEMKKSTKTTKLNELIIQNKETFKEFNKLKELYNNLFEENKANLEKIKTLSELENEINEKNLVILQLQESLKLSSETNLQYENEIEKLKNSVAELKYENQRLNNKLKTLYEYYSRNGINKEEKQNNVFELNEELSLHPKKIKNGISYNNTNRNYLKITNKINLDNRGNKRKVLNLSPISKKYIDDSKEIIEKEKNNNNSINNKVNNYKNDLNIIENEKNVNNGNEEEKNNNENNNLEKKNEYNDTSQTIYILIKNFEVLKISREDALTLIIKPILNEISNEKQIKNETLVNMFTNKICSCINCNQNENDINSISNVITSLLAESNNELFPFIKSFLDIFDNIKKYEENSNEEKEMVKKIKETLNKYKEFFIEKNSNEFISFFNFRALLNEKDIILDDEDIEYLIYRMKKDCPNIISKINSNKDNIFLSNKEEEKTLTNKQKEIDKNNDMNGDNKINENKNQNNKDFEKKCSIFDLNYKTFLNIIQ